MEFNGLFGDTKSHDIFNDIDNDIAEEDSHDWYKEAELESDKEEETNGAFCFETDHAALKGNDDYDTLMKTLSILEVQRIKTIKDIEKLEKMLLEVKYNARGYLNKIINGDTSDFPTNIDVAKVPKINWKKYRLKGYSAADTSSDQKTVPLPESPVKNNINSQKKDNDPDAMVVRGRIYDMTKPQTFNQLWTAEEQLRLEELLLQYPAESNENNRFRKIAKALGNRTTKQVCSRIQKYFKKLNEAGLPIPGHQLKTSSMAYSKKNHRRMKKPKQRLSTFFPSDYLDVNNHLCDEDEAVTAIPKLTPELKVDIIKKIIEYKKKDALSSPFTHPGIECGICGENPICGTRWSCLVCQTVNLCSDCVIDQLSSNPPIHPPTHPLEPVTNPSIAHWDPDYTPQSFQSNNYLDPNFITPSVI